MYIPMPTTRYYYGDVMACVWGDAFLIFKYLTTVCVVIIVWSLVVDDEV